MKPRIHTWRMLFRKPYKILLASLANLLVLLFTVVEGVQMIGTQAEMESAAASRIYTGTVGYLLTKNSSGQEIPDRESTVSAEALEILSSSPYVDSVSFARRRTARFGGGKRYVQGDAAEYSMFVGVACNEAIVRGEEEMRTKQFLLRPTYIAAGDPDTFSIGYGEGKIIPTVRLPYIEGFETQRDERYFLFAQTLHDPKRQCSNVSVSRYDTDPAEYIPGSTLLIGEKPGDEKLSDEEFAQKIMKTYGLEKFAERLDDLVDMTAVTELPSLEMLLPWRSGLMRLVSGRVLTEEDAGKKVCMFPSAMLSAIGKRVGDKVLLAISDHDLAGYASGIPRMGDEYDPGDFKDAEEYEVVGTYSNDATAYYYDNPKAIFLEDVLIPCSSALTPEDGMIRMDRFSFTVHKDDYDAFCAETQPLLKEAGYSVTMVTPEYAEIEEKIAEFREKSGSTFLKAGIALAAGLAVAAGSLVLFWRGEYLEERRLGAWRREAGGLYLRSFTVAAALSAASSVLIALLLGITRLAPFLSPEKLSASVWGIMALFSASELFIYGVLVFTVVLWMDRRKFGSGVPKNGHTASFASMSRKAGRRGQNLLPLFRRRTAWVLFASVILLLLLSVAWLDKTVSESRAEMERTIGEMSVRFQLSGGRKSGTGAAFSIEMSKLRQLLHMEYFEKFGGASLSLTVVAGEQPENISEREYLQILWTPDPEAAGIRAVEGELGDGLWLPAELAEKYRVSAGDELKVYRTGMGNFGKAEYLLHVAAITDGTKTYASEKCFDELFEFVNFNRDIRIGNRQLHISSSVMVGGVSFHLKKEYNTRLSEIERELQALLNTPHPDDRNRDVTVSYNSAEIDGMLEPLERTISSAEFFGRLFRAALPAVAYLIAILAILSFRNEVGVRRFLGEKSSSVFFEIWFPVLALFLPGYLLSALILLCSPLLPYAPWDLSLWHFLGTALFAAAALGILCALRPYDLLKEKEYE